MVKKYNLADGNILLSPHFRLKEFKSPDSNTVLVSTDLTSWLEKIFTACKTVDACILTSGYRTPSHSVKVGGSAEDAHTKGLAVDCIFYDENRKVIPPKYIACYAETLGFGGIGIISASAIHLDVRHLGGYVNKLWHGDEQNGYSLSANGKSFYSYFGLTKTAVEKYLGVTAPAPEKPKVTYLPRYTGKSVSIVDALKAVGAQTTYTYRTKLAKANGIKLYVGTAAQNKKLLELLKSGKLVKA